MGVDTVDSYARDQIGKIWGEIREGFAKIMATLIGVDGRNGLRSDVQKLTEQIKDVEGRLSDHKTYVQHYIDVQRKIDCFGLAEFRLRDQEADKAEEGEVEVEVAKIGARTAKEIGRWQANTSLVAAVLSFLGVVFIVIFK